MSLTSVGNIAIGYSKAVDAAAAQLAKPEVTQDAALMAKFYTDFQNAVSGYQIASQTAKDIHREDQTINDLLRDA
jgi:hypothetical protein